MPKTVRHRNAIVIGTTVGVQAPQWVTTRGLIAWALYDWANSAFPTVIETFVFAAYFVKHVAQDETLGSMLWGTTLSIAGLLVAVGGPFLGAVADQMGRRKPWLATLTAICVICAAMLWFVRPSPACIWLGLSMLAVASVSLEFASIFYNAMLPRLAPADHVGRWSGWGWALGYAGGLVCLIIALLGFVQEDNSWFELDRDSAQHVRATFLLVAAWYLVFSLPLFIITPDERSTGKPLRRAVQDGTRQLRDTFRQIGRYRQITRFLAAQIVYVNGLTTLFVFGGIYAATTFGMTEQGVLLFGIALNVMAGLGAAGFGWVDDRIGARRTILGSLIGLLVAGTVLLFISSALLFWIFGLLLGLFVGPVQAASRSYLARIAPPTLRNETFGLQALAGKGTSFLGPLMAGWVIYGTGSQRMGMSVVIGLFAIGLVMLFTVPESADKASQARAILNNNS